MKKQESKNWFNMLLGLALGYALSNAVDRGKTFDYIFVIVTFLIITAVAVLELLAANEEREYKAEIRERSKELEDESHEINMKMREALVELGKVMMPPRVRVPRSGAVFNTLSGSKPTEDVKRRGRALFDKEVNGGDQVWDEMGEPARESWYRYVELEDKEKAEEKNDDGHGEASSEGTVSSDG